jgi:MFS family permease
MLPMIRDEFSLDYTRSGVVYSAFNITYGVFQLPAGWLADRIGAKTLMLVGTCGVALAGLLISFSYNYITLLVFLALMGMVGGGYHPAAAPLVSGTLEADQQGQALGFHAIGGSFSFFLSPILAALIAGVWGWRSSFMVLAIPTMVLGIVLYVLLTRSAVGSRKSRGETQSTVPDTRAKAKWSALIAFLVMAVFLQSITATIAAFIPLFIYDNFGIQKEVAAIFLSIFFSAGMWASPLGGHLADRFGKTRILVVCGFACGPLIYLLGVVPYGMGISIGAVILAIGAILYFVMPTAEAYLVEYSPLRYRSTVLGIYYLMAIESGGLWAPVIGFLFDNFGFDLSFAIMGLSVLAMTAVCFPFLRKQGTRT